MLFKISNLGELMKRIISAALISTTLFCCPLLLGTKKKLKKVTYKKDVCGNKECNNKPKKTSVFQKNDKNTRKRQGSYCFPFLLNEDEVYL